MVFVPANTPHIEQNISQDEPAEFIGVRSPRNIVVNLEWRPKAIGAATCETRGPAEAGSPRTAGCSILQEVAGRLAGKLP